MNSVSLSNANHYKAYELAKRTESSVSELSKILGGEKVKKKSINDPFNPELSMDKVIISKEALELLRSQKQAG